MNGLNRAMPLLGLTFMLNACGVRVEAKTSTPTEDERRPYDTASYALYAQDSYGAWDTLTTGCIDLLTSSEESVTVYEDDGYDLVELEFAWVVLPTVVRFSVNEDGERLHTSRYRTSYFARGDSIEQRVDSATGSVYELHVKGQDCLVQ